MTLVLIDSAVLIPYHTMGFFLFSIFISFAIILNLNYTTSFTNPSAVDKLNFYVCFNYVQVNLQVIVELSVFQRVYR